MMAIMAAITITTAVSIVAPALIVVAPTLIVAVVSLVIETLVVITLVVGDLRLLGPVVLGRILIPLAPVTGIAVRNLNLIAVMGILLSVPGLRLCDAGSAHECQASSGGDD